MGKYESFTFRKKNLNEPQRKFLKEYGVSFTTKPKYYKKKESENDPVVLTNKKGKVKKVYINATTICWKQGFKKDAKKVKLKITRDRY
jgi:hypothetical protein